MRQRMNGTDAIRRSLQAVAVGVGLGGTVLAPAHAGDPVAGRALAERWCNACHALTEPEPRHADAGPPFADMAAREPADLHTAIRRPHDFMPEFPRLGEADIADLVAYIRTRH